MTFLLPLPTPRLEKGVSSHMFREEGPSGRVGPVSGEQKCARSAGLLAPVSRVAQIMCPRPAHAPTPTPTPDGGPPARLFLAGPYNIWPQRLYHRRLQPRQFRWWRQEEGAPGLLGDVAGSGPVPLG